jgi:hypothetical protein
MLSVEDWDWQNWINYLAANYGDRRDNWILLKDMGLRDFLVQIRSFHHGGQGDQSTFEECPVYNVDQLFDGLEILRTLGL